MSTVPNKTIALLLTLAIVISCAGVIFQSLEQGGVKEISGAGTIGEVNVTISQQIAINLTFPSIQFGSGYVNPGIAYACLESQTGKTTGWSSVTTRNSSIIIENIGNTDLNVTFNMDKTTATFIGGVNPRLEVKSASNESNSCDPAGTKGGVGSLVAFNANSSIVNANENRSVCNNLTARDAADSLTINVNLTIPADSLGTKGVMFTFEASIPK